MREQHSVFAGICKAITLAPCLLVLVSTCGCTTTGFLNRYTTRQASSFNEIIEQQVLDNVALFSNDRLALPHFAVIGDGSTQLTDQGTITPSIGWVARGFNAAGIGLNANRSLTENWKLQPVLTAGRVRRLRCAFQFAFGHPVITHDVKQVGNCEVYDVYVAADEGCINCVREFVSVGLLPAPACCSVSLKPNAAATDQSAPMPTPEPAAGRGVTRASFTPLPACDTLENDPKKCYLGECPPGHWLFKDEGAAIAYANSLRMAMNCNFPTGWFACGTKHDAKHEACLAGHQCDTYVWVAPGQQDAFSRFVISILALATLDPAPGKDKQEMTITLKSAKEDAANASAMITQVSREVEKLQEAIRQMKADEERATHELKTRAGMFSALHPRFQELNAEPLRAQALKNAFSPALQDTASRVAQSAKPRPDQVNALRAEVQKVLEAANQMPAVEGAENQFRANAIKQDARQSAVPLMSAIDNWNAVNAQAAAFLNGPGLATSQALAADTRAAAENIRAAARSIENVPSVSSTYEAPQDAFSRPGYMPLSRPTPGIEFVVPAAPQ